MSVQKDLIQILIDHGFIKKEEADLFHRYVNNSKEETYHSDDLFPTSDEENRLEKIIVNRQDNLRVFSDIIREVDLLLKKILTPDEYDQVIEECIKTVGYVPQELSTSHDRKVEAMKKLVEKLPDDVACRIIFDYEDINTNKKYVCIPGDAFLAIPTRSEDRFSKDISLYGTPIEVHRRKYGKLKGKISIPEYRDTILKIKMFRIAPAMDLSLSLGKLTRGECDYIKKFVYKISGLMHNYLGVKKGCIDINNKEFLKPSITNIVSNNVIDNSIKLSIEAGMDPVTANKLRDDAYNHKKVKCINTQCENTFFPINNKNKRCRNCSKPSVYLKEWRARHADQIFPPSEKDREKVIYIMWLDPKQH